MSRREFRLISGSGAGPSIQDITKRDPKRRHFKTIHAGVSTLHRSVKAVTLKGISKTTGATTWEYGPGSMWRHHYGAAAISGIVPNLSASLDKYAIAAHIGNQYVNAGNRNTATLTANVSEPLTITKLDSLDGTVIESAALTGMFCSLVDGASYQLSQGITIGETAALSGGDYVIVGRRVPFIEFVNFASNTSTKDYILHAHNQQGGNTYLKTRTSSEVITIPFNSTAAEVEVLFEATSDCTAATATGGPWPHLPIEIDVTWSVSGGDIAAIKTDATYTTSAHGTATWFWAPVDGDWTLTENNCLVGNTPVYPSFSGGGSSEYTDTECSGTPAATSTLNTAGVAATYDTGTGEISNSVGAIFGRAQTVILTRLIASTTAIPSVVGAESAGILGIVSGPDNSVVLTANQFAGTVNVGNEKARTIEAWTVGTTWTSLWKYYTNTGPVTALQVESGYACCSFPRQSFLGGGTACAATIEIDGGTISEYDNSVISSIAAYSDNRASIQMHEGDPTTKIISDYERTFTDADYVNLRFSFHLEGGQVWSDSVEYLLGINPAFTSQRVFSDGTAIYSVFGGATATINNDPPLRNPSILGGTNAKGYLWTFYTVIQNRFGSGTEFRFKFVASGAVTKYSSWLAWSATDSDITTALLAVFPENTGGVVSNINVYPFGAPSTIVNPDASLLEQGLEILFAGAAGATNPEGYISPAYINQRSSITVELQNVEQYSTPGIAAFDPSDGSIIWTRPWGTTASATISNPQYMWIRGDFVYAYGEIVEAEL